MSKVENELTGQGRTADFDDLVRNNTIESQTIKAVNPFADTGKYLVGGRATLSVNGKIFGFAFSVGFNIKTEQTEILTIDDYLPYEFAPRRISIDGTIGMLHIPGRGPSKTLAQANELSFLFHKYVTIEIVDQKTFATIFKSDKCVITSRSQSIQEGQLSNIQLSWRAIGWRDEMIPQVPVDAPPETPAST